MCKGQVVPGRVVGSQHWCGAPQDAAEVVRNDAQSASMIGVADGRSRIEHRRRVGPVGVLTQ